MTMTRAQRIVLIFYCLLVVYCCVWIPWHSTSVVTEEGETTTRNIRLGYAWVWSRLGPPALARYEDKLGTELDSQKTMAVWRLRDAETPDMPIIALCLLGATALGATAFLLAGRWKAKT